MEGGGGGGGVAGEIDDVGGIVSLTTSSGDPWEFGWRLVIVLEVQKSSGLAVAVGG